MEAEERVLRVVEEIVELDKALGSLYEHKGGDGANPRQDI